MFETIQRLSLLLGKEEKRRVRLFLLIATVGGIASALIAMLIMVLSGAELQRLVPAFSAFAMAADSASASALHGRCTATRSC